MGKGDIPGGNVLTQTPMHKKEEEKTKRTAMELESAEKQKASEAKTAAAEADTLRMEQDEDAVRKNILLSTLKDRLRGTRTSGTRLT